MTLLPIVERELRVASRRQFNYWSRVGAAAFVMVIFGGLLAIFELSRGLGSAVSAGVAEFYTLKWLAYIFACGTGVFLTSDSLSEEKREGTLGLLFLTDLRGYDVVLGKLISHSLKAFYGLLAAFPILALPLLLGGVTGTEFGRAMLVIGNTLFLSLAIGILASSLSREVMKAMNAALFLNLFFIIGLPWLDMFIANGQRFKCILSVVSPGYLFVAADGMTSRDFWCYLGLQNLLGWIFLATASLWLPFAWQDKTAGAKGLRHELSRWWRFGSSRSRVAMRKKLLGLNPVIWLASRDLWVWRLVFLATCITIGATAWDIILNWVNWPSNHYAQFVQGLLTLGVYIWVAAQACRIFIEATRSGAMELMLVTSLDPRQIARGQWKVLWRIFLIPVLLLAILTIVNSVEQIHSMRNLTTVTKAKTMPGMPNSNSMMIQYQVVGMVIGVVNLFFNLSAIAWFGMWMGVTTRKTSIAVLKTLCFVFVLPWMALVFIQFAGIGMMTIILASKIRAGGAYPFWLGMAVAGVLGMVKNIFFIAWSRHRLLNDLRETVSQGGRRPGRLSKLLPASLPTFDPSSP